MEIKIPGKTCIVIRANSRIGYAIVEGLAKQSPRRVEGRDKNDDSKKNLQLKVRKLSPIHTISYVRLPTSVFDLDPDLADVD
ncbi:hypothetical protein JHK87_052247 [Glycine soja]|nr:hypothetical protein JHK87_052247 [Glycine soja]